MYGQGSAGRKNKHNVFFLGSGSNVIASDNGFDGIVITLKKALNEIIFNEKYIYTQAGAMLGTMVKIALRKGYKGFESLVGVPGTVGGALIMNAGAHGTEISELLISSRTININGEIRTYLKEEYGFSDWIGRSDTETLLKAIILLGIDKTLDKLTRKIIYSK